MSVTRRNALKTLAAGTGSALFAPGVFHQQTADATGPVAAPKRVIFFLQNHGFDPRHARPVEIPFFNDLDRIENVDLRTVRLPRYIDLLNPYNDKLTILHGLNGGHVVPGHGAPYGCLGGYVKGPRPRGETIDVALSRLLPAVIPVLALSLENGRGNVDLGSSAVAAGRPLPMLQNPLAAYNNIFGVAAAGEAQERFNLETELYELLRTDAQRLNRELPSSGQQILNPYMEGLAETADRRRRLLAMRETLARYAPRLGDNFTRPQFETRTWEAHVELALAALKAGVTNVVTMAAGTCRVGGSWEGLGIRTRGHTLGHTDQIENEEWHVLRRFNMELLVRMIRSLEAEREGNGTMMDNTLIVYTSDCGEAHHSRGYRWPYLLIGNLGGRIRTGRYIHYPVDPINMRGSGATAPDSIDHRNDSIASESTRLGIRLSEVQRNASLRYTAKRSINALYTTLLRAVGGNNDYFNLPDHLRRLEPAGPLEELLV